MVCEGGLAPRLNNQGQVAGQGMNRDGVYHALLWSSGRMTDLGTLGPDPSGAHGINDAGQVVGWSARPRGGNPAFLWSGGVMHDLGTLGGDAREANAINAAGQEAGGAPTT